MILGETNNRRHGLGKGGVTVFSYDAVQNDDMQFEDIECEIRRSYINKKMMRVLAGICLFLLVSAFCPSVDGRPHRTQSRSRQHQHQHQHQLHERNQRQTTDPTASNDRPIRPGRCLPNDEFYMYCFHCGRLADDPRVYVGCCEEEAAVVTFCEGMMS